MFAVLQQSHGGVRVAGNGRWLPMHNPRAMPVLYAILYLVEWCPATGRKNSVITDPALVSGVLVPRLVAVQSERAPPLDPSGLAIRLEIAA